MNETYGNSKIDKKIEWHKNEANVYLQVNNPRSDCSTLKSSNTYEGSIIITYHSTT